MCARNYEITGRTLCVCWVCQWRWAIRHVGSDVAGGNWNPNQASGAQSGLPCSLVFCIFQSKVLSWRF